MKPVFKLGLCAIMVTGLVACSGGAEQRRQAKDDFSYLQTTPLSQWQTLPDQAPYFSTNYQIPEQDFQGEVGKKCRYSSAPSSPRFSPRCAYRA